MSIDFPCFVCWMIFAIVACPFMIAFIVRVSEGKHI